MDLLAKEYNLVLVLFLFSGTFGALVDPLPQNKTVLTGSTKVVINCASDHGFATISWKFAPLRTNGSRLISSGKVVKCEGYELDFSSRTTVNNLVIKIADASLAGVYICSDDNSEASAEITVIEHNAILDESSQKILYAVVGFGGALLIGSGAIFIYCCRKKKTPAKCINKRTIDHEMKDNDGPQRASNSDLIKNYPPNDCSTSASPESNQVPKYTGNDTLIYAVIQRDNNPVIRLPIEMQEGTIYADIGFA